MIPNCRDAVIKSIRNDHHVYIWFSILAQRAAENNKSLRAYNHLIFITVTIFVLCMTSFFVNYCSLLLILSSVLYALLCILRKRKTTRLIEVCGRIIDEALNADPELTLYSLCEVLAVKYRIISLVDLLRFFNYSTFIIGFIVLTAVSFFTPGAKAMIQLARYIAACIVFRTLFDVPAFAALLKPAEHNNTDLK